MCSLIIVRSTWRTSEVMLISSNRSLRRVKHYLSKSSSALVSFSTNANIFLLAFLRICVMFCIFFQWMILCTTFRHLCTILLSLCSMHSTMKVIIDSNFWLCSSEFIIFLLIRSAKRAKWSCMKHPTKT